MGMTIVGGAVTGEISIPIWIRWVCAGTEEMESRCYTSSIMDISALSPRRGTVRRILV